MKSKKRLIILCVLLVITIGIWAAVTFPYPQQIQADQVEKVVGPGGQLDAKDAEKLIRLFNTAKYRGNDLGYETTDEGAFSVHFKDGSILHIRNYGGKNYWVLGLSSQVQHFVDELIRRQITKTFSRSVVNQLQNSI